MFTTLLALAELGMILVGSILEHKHTNQIQSNRSAAYSLKYQDFEFHANFVQYFVFHVNFVQYSKKRFWELQFKPRVIMIMCYRFRKAEPNQKELL